MALTLILATLACGKPHLGGLKEPECSKIMPVLRSLLALTIIRCIDIRLDEEAQCIFSCVPKYAVFSTGLVVIPAVKGQLVETSPLAVAATGPGCTRKVKGILSELFLNKAEPMQEAPASAIISSSTCNSR